MLKYLKIDKDYEAAEVFNSIFKCITLKYSIIILLAHTIPAAVIK